MAMSSHDNIPLEGELNCWERGFDLPDLLLAVCETGSTGLLRFSSAEAEKTLFVKEGEIVFAKSTSIDDRLGQYLLRQGKVSLRSFEKLSSEVKPGKRLGGLLVEQGLLMPRELVGAVVGQVSAIVLSLFHWSEAWYGFSEQELPGEETITLNMPLARLIVKGIGQIDSWRRISRGCDGVDSVFQLVAGNEGIFRPAGLDDVSIAILTSLREPLSVSQTCRRHPLPDIQICRQLWAFRSLNWIERVPTGGALSLAAPENLTQGDVEALLPYGLKDIETPPA